MSPAGPPILEASNGQTPYRQIFCGRNRPAALHIFVHCNAFDAVHFQVGPLTGFLWPVDLLICFIKKLCNMVVGVPSYKGRYQVPSSQTDNLFRRKLKHLAVAFESLQMQPACAWLD